jgi:hypothetical protein
MPSVDYAGQWNYAPTEEIVARLGWLLAQINSLCNCELTQREIRLRTASNGSKHHVMQCMGCGEQRGGALGDKAAKASLGNRSALTFDDQVHIAYVAKRRALSDEHSALHEIWLSRERPEVLPSLRAAREADEARAERIKATVAKCVEELQGEVSELLAADALSKEAVAIRKRHRLALIEATKRFRSEPELKAWLEEHLGEDFILKPEVVGKHTSESVRVQIDYIAYAKPHLIAHGFEPEYFGIEVKYLDQTDGFTHKASRGIWQTVSYTDSTFFVDGHWRRLKFALVFSNLCFEEERELLEAELAFRVRQLIPGCLSATDGQADIEGKCMLGHWPPNISSRNGLCQAHRPICPTTRGPFSNCDVAAVRAVEVTTNATSVVATSRTRLCSPIRQVTDSRRLSG